MCVITAILERFPNKSDETVFLPFAPKSFFNLSVFPLEILKRGRNNDR